MCPAGLVSMSMFTGLLISLSKIFTKNPVVSAAITVPSLVPTILRSK